MHPIFQTRPQLSNAVRVFSWVLVTSLLALALASCGDADPIRSEANASVVPSPTSTMAMPASTTVPDNAGAATELPSITPTAAESPTVDEADAEIPEGQEVDLPEVDLAYEIDASLDDFDAGLVRTVSMVRVTNREDDALARLYFRVAPAHDDQFVLHAIERDGQDIDVTSFNNGTTLAVSLDPALPAGAITELRFSFTIAVRDTGNAYGSITRDGPVLRLGYWYPMLSNDASYPPLLDPPFTRTADYQVSFTAPEDVVVAAPGLVSTSASNSDLRSDYTLRDARDFALMMSRDYEIDERRTDTGVAVMLYTVTSRTDPVDESQQAAQRDRAFTAAERSLVEYEDGIGPYPWSSLTIVDGGPSLNGGIEYTALTAIDFDSSGIESLVAHEVAHMWFYAVIGTRTQLDPWVDEGAATFLANGLISGYGATGAQAMTFAATLDASVYDLASLSTREWLAAVYVQGGAFYADVFMAMGADAFWSAMEAIYVTQAFDIATPYEVLSIFQQHSPTDLRPLFDRYFAYEWIDLLDDA